MSESTWSNNVKCPHCGKEIERLLPEGWIMVPKDAWNRLVEKADAKLPQEQERDAIDYYLMEAEKRTDDALRFIRTARRELNPCSERTLGGKR